MNIGNIRTDIPFGTNINSIEVPDHLRVRVKTGVEYFDDVIGGQGFTPTMTTLFTGTPGAGKTTMLLSAADAITGSGNIALFNTGEESLYQVSLVAERLKLRNGFLTGDKTHVGELLEQCDKIVKANKGKKFFLFIDSLQTLNDGKYGLNRNSKTPIRSLEMITSWAKKTGAMPIVIGQVNKSGKMAGSNTLKHMVDCHVHLSVEQKDEELMGARVLEAEKNRFGGCGGTFYLELSNTGFREVARVSAIGL